MRSSVRSRGAVSAHQHNWCRLPRLRAPRRQHRPSSVASEVSEASSLNGVNVAVIGGGPGGVLSAAHFAKLGAQVTVYERRTEAEQTAPQLGWAITLGNVASEAIEAAGLSTDLGVTSTPAGQTVQFGLSQPRYMAGWGEPGSSMIPLTHITTRARIIYGIRSQVEASHPSLVTFADGYSVVGGDICSGELVVQPGEDEGARERVVADIVVAADGTNSRARARIQQLDPSLHVSSTPGDTAILPVPLPPCDPTQVPSLPTPCGKPLHIAPPDHTDPVEGGWVWFGAPTHNPPGAWFWLTVRGSRCGKDLTLGLSALQTWWDKEKSEPDVLATLKEIFPYVPLLWLQELAKTAATASADNGLRVPTFVTCSKLGSGRAVLIGDAAHAVSANIGAGACSALQDAMFLAPTAASVVSATPGDGRPPREKLANFADAWTEERGADAKAVTALSQGFNDVMYYQYTKNLYKFVRAFPIIVHNQAGLLQRFGRLGQVAQGLLSLPRLQVVIVNGGQRPGELYSTLVATAFKVAAVVCAAVAAVVAILLQVVPRLAAGF